MVVFYRLTIVCGVLNHKVASAEPRRLAKIYTTGTEASLRQAQCSAAQANCGSSSTSVILKKAVQLIKNKLKGRKVDLNKPKFFASSAPSARDFLPNFKASYDSAAGNSDKINGQPLYGTFGRHDL
jgi:hypothetical protein